MLSLPPPKIDLPAIKSLMVEAAKSAAETKNLLAGKNTSAPNKLLAGSVMALYGVVEALLEQALFPLVEHYRTPPPAATQVATPPPLNPPKPASSGRRWRGPTKRRSSSVPTWARPQLPTGALWPTT